jgi:hypothetical protein
MDKGQIWYILGQKAGFWDIKMGFTGRRPTLVDKLTVGGALIVKDDKLV